jgi:hypothetical protein
MPCHSCGGYATDAIQAAGFDAVRIRDLVDVREASQRARSRVRDLRTVAECEAYVLDGRPIGRHVRISVAWFLSRGTLLDDAETLDAYRSFLVSGSVLQEAFVQLLDSVRPDRVFVLNGLLFPERILAELATEQDIPVVRYEKGFFTDSVLVSRWRPESSILDLGDAAWRQAETRPLGSAEAGELDAYLVERERGGRTLDNFWTTRISDAVWIRSELSLRDGNPVVVAFLNVVWDSAIQGRDVAFPSMGEWLVQAIEWAQRHQDVDMIVRLHPAEVGLANHVSRERMADHIETRFPQLPPNVHVVGAESTISSYALMDMAALGLVYTSTVGLEMASRGVPVICAGAGHYAGRGFTENPQDAVTYWRTVDEMLESPRSAEDRERRREAARRYAHLFFFRYHQFLDVVHEVARSRPRVTVDAASDLRPGLHPSLDRVVNCILDGDGPAITPIAEESDG